MLFTGIMSKRKIYLYSGLVIILFVVWIFSESSAKNEVFSEHVKVSLREAGHQLLLANKDSTSLVLPVIEVAAAKYTLSFEKELAFLPNDLVRIVKESFIKAELPEYYRVSVIQNDDHEVAYSYEMNANEESNIIPCAGRYLPNNKYTIDVRFTKIKPPPLNKKWILYLLLFVVLAFLLQVVFSKNKPVVATQKNNENFVTIGSFQFYPEQNKLVKAAQEIGLSKKECEILEIFVANPNQIIRRDELTKRVWEDNGVIVGRSLDTYISKLRKKLKDDTAIKLTNIHGVGYKLEVE